MKISALLPTINNYKQKYYGRKFCPDSTSALSPLKCDTVSFGAMKKSQFSGIDLLVVNKFKAPIEKFKTNEDLQNWCDEQIENIVCEDYKGRGKETRLHRKAILVEWFEYFQYEDAPYAKSATLLTLDGVVKYLYKYDDTLPPVLHKDVLAETIEEIQQAVEENPKADVNFLKAYNLNLQKMLLGEQSVDEGGLQTGWIVIPSYKNDPENFKSNVEKLKMLSHHNWCTKNYSASTYLVDGDLHIYLEQGKPKLCVRFKENTVEEIQGEKNDTEIPLEYFEIAREYILGEELSSDAEEEIDNAARKKSTIENLLERDFPDGIENYSAEYILRSFGAKVEEDEDGLLSIDSYRQPHPEYRFVDFGVDENKLFEHVREIRGDADFSNSRVTNLGNLQTIGGNAIFRDSKITNLGNLQSIAFNADFLRSQVLSLGNLRSIGDNADFRFSEVEDLGNLQTIGGNANFFNSKITSLGNLRSVGQSINLRNSRVSDLGSLQSVGGDADFGTSQIKSLGDLRTIEGSVSFMNSEVEDMGMLETIGGDVDFIYSRITDLGNLRSIGGDADIRLSDVTSLGSLQTLGGAFLVNINQQELAREIREKGFAVQG